MAKGGLGVGLDALFSDNTSDVQVKKTLRLSEIEPNRDQPRKSFSDEAITALAESIREHGVLQPILVRPLDSGGYQIVAGERRWRAARMLGLDEIPVNIRELSDSEAMQIAIIENLQRENLNPVEEANGYNELIEKYGMTQDKVAKMVGISRSAVANSVRLLALPKRVLGMLEEGKLSAGHAKALLGINDEEMLIAVANRAADGGMTVRQVENLAQKSTQSKTKEDKPKKISDEERYCKEMQISLQLSLGRKVEVKHGKKKGTITLEYYGVDDLRSISELLAPSYQVNSEGELIK